MHVGGSHVTLQGAALQDAATKLVVETSEWTAADPDAGAIGAALAQHMAGSIALIELQRCIVAMPPSAVLAMQAIAAGPEARVGAP